MPRGLAQPLACAVLTECAKMSSSASSLPGAWPSRNDDNPVAAGAAGVAAAESAVAVAAFVFDFPIVNGVSRGEDRKFGAIGRPARTNEAVQLDRNLASPRVYRALSLLL